MVTSTLIIVHFYWVRGQFILVSATEIIGQWYSVVCGVCWVRATGVLVQ